MGFSNNLLTKPFTKIAVNGQGDLQRALGSSSLSHVTLIGNSTPNKWARYKRTCHSAVMMDNKATTSRSVSYGPYSFVGAVENAAGDLNGEVNSSAATTSGIVFWRIYGLYVPVIKSTDAYYIKTAIDAMNNNKAGLDWPVIPYADYPANYKYLRAMDFDGYKANVAAPFKFSATNGYSNNGPNISFQYNNIEEASYCTNFAYIMRLLGNPSTLKPCVVVYPSSGSPVISEGSSFNDVSEAIWNTPVIAGGTASGLAASVYFCMRDTSKGITILAPVGISGSPNPVSIRLYNTIDPSDNPFTFIKCDPYSDTNNVELYTRTSGSSVTIRDVYDNYKGLLTNGYAAFRLRFTNTSSTAKTVRMADLTFFFQHRNSTLGYTAYNSAGAVISGSNITIAGNSSETITFEFGSTTIPSTVPGGLVSESNNNGMVSARYQGTNIFSFVIRYRYSTTGAGTVFTE